MGMTYELAKQLKEAGFPQGGTGDHWFTMRNVYDGVSVERHNNENLDVEEWFTADPTVDVYTPSLPELIEACGDDFFQLTKGSEDWISEADIETEPQYFRGSTPEEAVAKLYIALKNK